jgi:microcystin-dependent protein
MSFTSQSIGGEYTHKLNQNEIPNYYIGDIAVPVPSTHVKWANNGIVPTEMGQASSDKIGVKTISEMNRNSGTQYGWSIHTNGGDKPHNNLQPFITVAFWKRIS